ncbi:GGNBP2 family protein [Megaselia abdita]
MHACLIDIYRKEDPVTIGKRQLLVSASENLNFICDLRKLCFDTHSPIKGKDLATFKLKYNILSRQELREALTVNIPKFMDILKQTVSCVGCRRGVERLITSHSSNAFLTFDPIQIDSGLKISVSDELIENPQLLGTLLYRHQETLTSFQDNNLKNKTRCGLHLLDSFRSKPFSEYWIEVWKLMKMPCREEITVIETSILRATLENYLLKHKFCQECRTKVEKAYKLLIEDGGTVSKEKGFSSALYSNIRKCETDKHIHIPKKIQFIDNLIRKAEPEINGIHSKFMERHAKTLEIAQEEVLTCVGIVLYERLKRLYINMREEERACQVFSAISVHALYRNLNYMIEEKQGFSNLELLICEMSREEERKERKNLEKRIKKKMKKEVKKCERNSKEFDECNYNHAEFANSSSSTPEGSEISCGNKCCDNQEICEYDNSFKFLSLQEMLEHLTYDDDCYIPEDVICHHKVSEKQIHQQRQELRQNLRKNFDNLRFRKKSQICEVNC